MLMGVRLLRTSPPRPSPVVLPEGFTVWRLAAWRDEQGGRGAKMGFCTPQEPTSFKAHGHPQALTGRAQGRAGMGYTGKIPPRHQPLARGLARR